MADLPAGRLAGRGRLLGVTLALLALVVAAVMTLGSDTAPRGSAVGSEGETLAQEDDAEAGEDQAADSLTLEDLPGITFELVITRDPFEPVRPEPVSNGNDDAANGDGTAPNGNDVDGNGNDTAPNGDNGRPPPDPAPGDPCQPDGDLFDCEGNVLRVLEVSEDGARVQVGDVVYEPQVGQAFAQVFVLGSVRGGCAAITYDGRQTFQACPDGSAFK